MLRTVFKNRKDLVKAVSEFTGENARYMGAPTFSYTVGVYTIDKAGSITSDSEMDKLKDFLIEKGFIQQEPEKEPKLLVENKPNQQESIDSIELSIPIGDADKTAVINFVNMLYSKQYLINRALQMVALSIHDSFLEQLKSKELSEIINDEYSGFKIENNCFVFDYPNTDNIEMFPHYMTLMCMAFSKAKESTRVQAKLIHPENEKYYMRCWLIRLGLGGRGGAETRKALLKNLKGHTAFRTEEEIERAKEKYKQKKAEKQQ